MFELTVASRFSATHQLSMPDGSVEPLHEHDWSVKVTVAGDRLDEAGLLVDFGMLKRRLTELLEPLTGQCLNNSPPFGGRNPSAENVAVYLAEQLAAGLPVGVYLRYVEVEEEPGCTARYFSASE